MIIAQALVATTIKKNLKLQLMLCKTGHAVVVKYLNYIISNAMQYIMEEQTVKIPI
jgi:hypothetical protein